ncbi:MAG: hypothetical protein ACRDP3_26760 [Streptomyces sp.]|uniref:hypothetical protein n=1 Tax=Streptomyces sp. TaxID=1931 RepID=UPI003D6C5975
MTTARAHPHRSAGLTAALRPAPPAARQTRLPWWALLLPALAFAVLLALLLGSGRADAADQQAAQQSFAQVLDRVAQVLLG